jgi:hypothetical protein
MENKEQEQITIPQNEVVITRTEMIPISYTTDFDKFFDSPLNRPLSTKHAKNLLKSLKENGYDINTPILCDQSYILLDGHHKREAMKMYFEETGLRMEFNFKIIFCKNDEERLRHMQIHNAYKKDWSIKETLRISQNDFARFYKTFEKKYGHVIFTFDGYDKNRIKKVKFTDYMDPYSVAKSVGMTISKTDLAGIKKIGDQEQCDMVKLYEVVLNTMPVFTKIPVLKRVFIDNCGKIATLLFDESKQIDFMSWKSYIGRTYSEEFINSEKFVVELDKTFRKFLREE